MRFFFFFALKLASMLLQLERIESWVKNDSREFWLVIFREEVIGND